jgi:hypothetical protein
LKDSSVAFAFTLQSEFVGLFCGIIIEMITVLKIILGRDCGKLKHWLEVSFFHSLHSFQTNFEIYSGTIFGGLFCCHRIVECCTH